MFRAAKSIVRQFTHRMRNGDFNRSCTVRRRHLRGEQLEDRVLLAQTVGLFVNEPEAYEGYTLFAPSSATTTYLIDIDGKEVNAWASAFQPMSAYLLPNGDLLRTAQLPSTAETINAPGGAGRVELFDWDGNLKWSYELNETDGLADGIHDRRLHHDIEILPNGNILMIAWERFTRNEALAQGRNPSLPADNNGEVWPDMVIEVQPDYAAGAGGEIVWEWHLWDHLVQQYDATKPNWRGTNGVAAHPELANLNYVPGGEGAGGVAADWTHFIVSDYNPDLDQIVVSSREFSEFWIIDHSTTTEEAAGHTGGNAGRGGDILYRWGNPAAYNRGSRAGQQLFYQHDAQWIEPGLPGEGNLLVFNNGWNRSDGSSYSSADEVAAPLSSQWYLNNRPDGSVDEMVHFDVMAVPDSWQTITGDWDGDGTDTVGLYDPGSSTFHLYGTTPDSPLAFTAAGADAGWLPIVGDWDGNGTDNLGLYDQAAHTFHFYNQTGDGNPAPAPFVTPDLPASWLPLAGDWDGDGDDTVGVYDPAGHTFYLNNKTSGTADIVFTVPLIPRSWRPVAGNWKGTGGDTIGLYNPQYAPGNYVLVEGIGYGPAAPTWTYASTPRSTFFATIISGMQRLPNGNTLIDEGTEGRFFEVTPDGRIVWEYVNPVIAGGRILTQGTTVPTAAFGIPGVKQNLVFRAYRYGIEYFDEPLQTTLQNMEPGSPIEGYRASFDTVGLVNPTVFDWYLNNRVDGTTNDMYEFNWPGGSGDWAPIAGDWDGDGHDTAGIYDRATQTFHLINQSENITDPATVFAAPAAQGNWLPIAGDWNGDGLDDVGLYDQANHTFHFYDPLGTDPIMFAPFITPPLPAHWLAVAGDWDGDGDDTVGVYDPTNHTFYVNNEIDGSTDRVITFVTPPLPAHWLPLAGDWNGDGKDTLGIYGTDNHTFYLNNKLAGTADYIFVTPPVPATWLPVTGDWNASKQPGGSAAAVLVPAGVTDRIASGGDSTYVSARVEIQGDAAIIFGTDGDDHFEFDAAAMTVNINGEQQVLPADAIRSVSLFAGLGQDVVILHDSPADEILVADSFQATMTNRNGDLRVDVTGHETLLAYSNRGGYDVAQLHGTEGADKFKFQAPSDKAHHAKVYGAGQYNRVKNFELVQAFASGGDDLARVFSTAGTTTFDGQYGFSRSQGSGFDVQMHQFPSVVAHGGKGADVARLIDSALDDVLHAKSHKSVLFDRATGGERYQITVRGFQTLHAEASAVDGGIDKVRLWDTAADDLLELSADGLRLLTPAQAEALYELFAFEIVKAASPHGQNDKVKTAGAPAYDLSLEGIWQDLGR